MWGLHAWFDAVLCHEDIRSFGIDRLMLGHRNGNCEDSPDFPAYVLRSKALCWLGSCVDCVRIQSLRGESLEGGKRMEWTQAHTK